MLTTVFWICLTIQMGYMLLFFRHIYSLPRIEYFYKYFYESERKPASIIICAKNEAENLRKNLPKILSQKYYGAHSQLLYEVIVVDNGSIDGSYEFLNALQVKYKQLIVLVEPKEGKKNALRAGVAAASHNWLVFTDADCRPSSNHWLMSMIRPLSAGKEIVLGYSGFYEAKGLLNKFIRWETVHTFLQYSTYAMAGLPYMGVGRNLACTRDIMEGVMQNPKWNKLLYGDDDLLVSLAGIRNNTAIMCESRAFTYSRAKRTWKEWAQQKQRHLSVGKYYKLPVKVLLGIYGISHAIMWITFLCAMATPLTSEAYMGMIIRYFFLWKIWNYMQFFLRVRGIKYNFPLFDIGWMIYNFAFLPYIAFKNKQNWK